MDIKLGILTSTNDSYLKYVTACEEQGVPYEVVDLLASDWVARIRASDCDGFLARPPCDFQERKSIYDERLYFLSHAMGRRIYPSYDELFIYENKRAVSYFLDIHGFPHPETHVFVRKADALDHMDRCELPVVFKANIGASATQVQVVRDRAQGRSIIQRVFGVHPELAMGFIGYHYKGVPVPLVGRIQRHYVIMQRFESIKWEWRIIKIGGSFFGHRRLLKGDFASGALRFAWGAPPEELLWLVKRVCDTGGFDSISMDVFECVDGRFLINELQSIFGSREASQMRIDGKPGRYLLRDGRFVFEEGVFNRHKSYPLRVADFVEKLRAEKAAAAQGQEAASVVGGAQAAATDRAARPKPAPASAPDPAVAKPRGGRRKKG